MSEQSNFKAEVLIVDDEKEHAQVMSDALTRQGHRCDLAYSLSEAKEKLNKKSYDIIVTDLVMDGKRDGLEVLKLSKDLTPPPQVILVSAHGDIPIAVEAMNEGAYGFIEKPLDLSHFRAQVNRAAERVSLQRQNQVLRDQLSDQSSFEGIVGKSAAMQKLLATARQVAASDIPVLIMGESGTGKELIARAIHFNSKRRRNRLVTLNCAGLSESILEDELFGHVRGAFTGAKASARGASSTPTAGRSSWTRSATCRPPCRPSSCVCWKTEKSSGWAATSRSKWMCGLSARQTENSRTWSPTSSSGRIYSSGLKA